MKGIIQIRVKDVGDFVQVEIEDNGKGIASKDLPYIFDRFYRTDVSRNSSKGGSGIGLSIVKAIMDSMHQKFGVKNYDNGVEFWFELEADNGREMKSEMTEEFAKPVEVKGEKTEQNEP